MVTAAHIRVVLNHHQRKILFCATQVAEEQQLLKARKGATVSGGLHILARFGCDFRLNQGHPFHVRQCWALTFLGKKGCPNQHIKMTEMNMIQTKNPKFSLRFATPEDAALVVAYMKKLGAFQKMPDKIIATEEGIRKLLMAGKGEAVFGDYEGQTVGFIYFCHNSSAFIGQSGLYIDGFLIDDAVRFKGLGKIMMAFMSKLAVERDCQRLEWGCLDWNEPTIKFYRDMGAYSVDAMTIFRFSPEQLKLNAGRF